MNQISTESEPIMSPLPVEERRKPIGSANKAIVDEVVMDLSEVVRALETINDSREVLVRNQACFKAQKIVFESILKLKQIKR